MTFSKKMSCLFNSLGFLLDVDSTALRQQICDAFEANVPLMDGVETKDLLFLTEGPDYIAHMRSRSSWGGAYEIQMACILYEIRVLVENRRDGTAPIEFLPYGKTHARTAVIYWTGGHYEPVSIL